MRCGLVPLCGLEPDSDSYLEDQISRTFNPMTERLSWAHVGDTEDDFVREAENLYWKALEFELADSLLSLKWMLNVHQQHEQQPAVEETKIPSPSPLEDRVPCRLGPPMWAWSPIPSLGLEEVLGKCMPKAMEYTQELQDIDEELLLARYVLLGLGLLDIDEIVEYRDPLVPSQGGPPRFVAERAEDGTIRMSMNLCSCCRRPIRGLAWTCRAGCQDAVEGLTKDSARPESSALIVCMLCYSKELHPTQHLVRSPHKYPIAPSLQRELDAEDFWRIRREIQRQQDAVDAEQDRAEQGLLRSFVTYALSSISRGFFPLGNVHSCLILGPLTFEIGVPDSKGGVRVSTRRPPNLGKSWGPRAKQDVLALSPDRKLFKAQTPAPAPRRVIQAAVKQTLGGVFSGYCQENVALEMLVIQMMYAGARGWTEHPLRPRAENHKSLLKTATKLIGPLKLMIGAQLKVYIQTFARALFDREANLHWARFTNNCQNFCDLILQQPCFSTVFPNQDQVRRFSNRNSRREPDHLLSFRTERNLGDTLLASKTSSGPLATFFKQLHNPDDVLNAQADMVEQDTFNTASDLGKKPAPLNCARLLAWPCQEPPGPSAESSSCCLADHIWTNPAEYASILQMHLLVDRGHYLQPARGGGGGGEGEGEEDQSAEPLPLTDLQWAQNRISVLEGVDMLNTSAGAMSRVFQERFLSLREEGEDNSADDGGTRSEWKPPLAYCIPQDYPFTCDGDEIHLTYQDPAPPPGGSNRSSSASGGWFRRWFSGGGEGSSREGPPDIKLPAAGDGRYSQKLVVVEPFLGHEVDGVE